MPSPSLPSAWSLPCSPFLLDLLYLVFYFVFLLPVLLPCRPGHVLLKRQPQSRGLSQCLTLAMDFVTPGGGKLSLAFLAVLHLQAPRCLLHKLPWCFGAVLLGTGVSRKAKGSCQQPRPQRVRRGAEHGDTFLLLAGVRHGSCTFPVPGPLRQL